MGTSERPARMDLTAEGLLQLLEGYLPEGFSAWSSEFRPDVARYLREAEDKIRQAVSAGDRRLFAEAVRECSARYVRSASLFEADQKTAPQVEL